MARWRFVHAADLHLDSPFVGLAHYHADLREELLAATFAALARLVDLCLSCRAEFLLLAGDLFDGPRLSLRAQVRLRQELARLAQGGIDTFIAWGNHDYLAASAPHLDWPPRVEVCPPGEVAQYEVRRGGATLARIFGVSHANPAERENLAAQFPPAPSGPLAIGLLHANLDHSPGHDDYAPCSLADLARTGYDYWALGHIHQPGVRRLAQPTVVYPGNPQGRHLKEAGCRGCYVVEVDGHALEPRFQETGVITWETRHLDVSDISRLIGVADRLQEAVEAARPEPPAQGRIVRFTLTGRGPVHRDLRLPGNQEDLLDEARRQGQNQRPWVWVESLVLATAAEQDLEALATGSDLAAMILEMMAAAQAQPDLPADLQEALKSLYLRPQGRRSLPPLESLNWPELAAQATEEILARLFPGDEE